MEPRRRAAGSGEPLSFRQRTVRNEAYGHVMTDTDQTCSLPWEPPLAGTEAEQLLGRSTGCARPSAGRPMTSTRPGSGPASAPPHSTLAGLLKHLALVEDHSSATKLPGKPPGSTVEGRRLGRRPRLGVHLLRR